MKHAIVAAIAITVLSVVVSPSLAQQASGPAGSGQRGGRMYNPATVETVTGEVVSVEQVRHGEGRGRRGGGQGLHLMLKTDKEEIAVHLGPARYIEKQGLKIQPKDTVEVRGSRVTFEGKPAIIAAEVKKGDQMLKLRDTNGVPAWSGGKGR